MKSLILAIAIIFSGLSAFAQSCLGEAQFAAKVAQVRQAHDGSCIAYISNVSHYNEHMFCPLSLNRVLKSGIDITDRVGSNCSYNHQEISGVVVLKADGKIYLD